MFKLSKMAMIFVVSAAIAVLSILSAFLQYKKDKESGAERLKSATELVVAYKKLQDKSDELQKKSNEIIDSTREISRLQNELIIANNEIITLQKEAINQVTGGELDLNVMPEIPLQRPNVVGFGIKNDGQYTVSDITISVTNMTQFKKEFDLHGDIMNAMDLSTVKLAPISSIISKDWIYSIYLSQFPIEDKRVAFSIHVRCRNGAYIYQCEFERNENGKISIRSQGKAK